MATADVDVANEPAQLDHTLTENAETRLKRPYESMQAAATGPSTDSPAADKGEKAEEEEQSPLETPQKKVRLDSETDSSKKAVPSAYNKLRSQKLLPERYVRQVLVLKPQGDLSTLTGTKQLFTATKDALDAMIRMHRDLGMVHGAIALSHIMINKDGSGTLIDWDIPGVENMRMR